MYAISYSYHVPLLQSEMSVWAPINLNQMPEGSFIQRLLLFMTGEDYISPTSTLIHTYLFSTCFHG